MLSIKYNIRLLYHHREAVEILGCGIFEPTFLQYQQRASRFSLTFGWLHRLYRTFKILKKFPSSSVFIILPMASIKFGCIHFVRFGLIHFLRFGSAHFLDLGWLHFTRIGWEHFLRFDRVHFLRLDRVNFLHFGFYMHLLGWVGAHFRDLVDAYLLACLSALHHARLCTHILQLDVLFIYNIFIHLPHLRSHLQMHHMNTRPQTRTYTNYLTGIYSHLPVKRV